MGGVVMGRSEGRRKLKMGWEKWSNRWKGIWQNFGYARRRGKRQLK
jgi:hypothetical protein